MRSEEEVRLAIGRHADTVQRICLLYLKNTADTDDIFQEVFLKYALSDKVFESEEHEKAWVIRVTINRCKDFLKSLFRRREELCDLLPDVCPCISPTEHQVELMQAVTDLPKKYRDAVYLHCCEGYTAEEIGRILGQNKNTVYTHLARARKLLTETLGGEF